MVHADLEKFFDLVGAEKPFGKTEWRSAGVAIDSPLPASVHFGRGTDGRSTRRQFEPTA